MNIFVGTKTIDPTTGFEPKAIDDTINKNSYSAGTPSVQSINNPYTATGDNINNSENGYWEGWNTIGSFFKDTVWEGMKSIGENNPDLTTTTGDTVNNEEKSTWGGWSPIWEGMKTVGSFIYDNTIGTAITWFSNLGVDNTSRIKKSFGDETKENFKNGLSGVLNEALSTARNVGKK